MFLKLISKFLDRTRKLSPRQVLLIILLIAAIVRFIDYPSRWTFFQDQARELIVARESINQKYLPPLGPKASPGFFAPAPYWYWYVIIAQLLWSSIISPTLGITFLSLVTIAFIFLICRKISDDISLALIAGLFAALSPELIRFSLTATNPSFIPILTAAAIYFAISWIQEKQSKSLFLVAFFVSLSFSFHLQGLGTIPILILAILLAFPRKISSWLLIITGLVLPLAPLLFFDLKHNWYNTGNLYHYFFRTQRAFFDKITWPAYFSRFWPEIFASATGKFVAIGFVFFALSFLYFVLSSIYKRKTEFFIFAIFIFDVFGLRYYKADKLNSYLVFVLPVIILAISLICWRIIKISRYLGIVLIIALLVLNIWVINSRLVKENWLGKTTTAKEKITEKGEEISLYHYPENWNASLPILVLLEEEEKLDKEGVKVGICLVFPQEMIKEGIRKACPKDPTPESISVIKIYDLEEKDLEKSLWQELSWSKVYQESVFWWKK